VCPTCPKSIMGYGIMRHWAPSWSGHAYPFYSHLQRGFPPVPFILSWLL
jgi:hypothetical protein